MFNQYNHRTVLCLISTTSTQSWVQLVQPPHSPVSTSTPTTQSWVQPVLQPPHSSGFNQYSNHHTVLGSPVQPHSPGFTRTTTTQSWVPQYNHHIPGFNQYNPTFMGSTSTPNTTTVLGALVQPPHSPGFNQYSNHNTVLGSTSTTTTQSWV